MPLQKQNISISFAQGLDTKTDPRQVVPGKLEALQNSKFETGMELTKRNGYTSLGTLSSGVGKSVGSYQDEVVSFDRYNLYSYVPESSTEPSKGFSQPVDFSTRGAAFPSSRIYGVSAGNTFNTDSARNGGYILYVYADTKYIIVSESTNQIIVPEYDLAGIGATGPNPRAFALGNYFLILTIGSLGRVSAYSIPISNVSATPTERTIFSSATGARYDAVVIGSSLFVAANSGTNIKVASIDSSLTASSTTTIAAGGTVTCVGVWSDTTTSPAQFWIGLYNGTDVRYTVLNSSSFATVQAVTTLETIANVVSITGSVIGTGSLSVVYYEVAADYAYTAIGNNYIKSVTATNGGTVGTPNTLQRGVSLFSRSFQMYSDRNYNYFIVLYGPANGTNLQNTFFLLSHHVYSGGILSGGGLHPNPVIKFSQGNAPGFPAYGTLQNVTCNVNAITTSKVQFAFPKNTRVATSGGSIIVTQGAIFNAVADFGTSNSYQYADLGNDLNYTGGFLWMYDSGTPYENNFHLFPENMTASYIDTTGSIAKNPVDTPYQYIALYKWQDARGNVHRSAPSVALSKDISGSATDTNKMTINVPTLRLTEKANEDIVGSANYLLKIELYRNTPTAPGGNATDIFYLISTTGANENADYVAITDTQADASIVGNQILYTTGGVVENSGGPPCNAITIYKSRLFVCDAENRNTLWYSKQVINGSTPVEMCASFTLNIDPRFGDTTALAVLDDKLVVFKNNAIFYITGNGPDNTGANNDFSDATFVASNAGCVDPRSVVVTQDGLMFKSNKGIYLLDRGLGVSYIGAPVEAYNGSHVTGAVLIPNSTQVQFTLDDSATCLMYDYFYKQWSVYLNHNAVAATVYSNRFTYIDSTGEIFKEAVGTYSDDGTAIYQSLTTSWLSLAGLQGFQRVYRVFFLYKYISAHSVRVDVAYDFNDTVAQSVTLDATSLAATNGSVGQWMINLDKQKCQAIKISITEIADSGSTIGGGLNIEAIGLLVGAKLSYPKLPAAQEVTS